MNNNKKIMFFILSIIVPGMVIASQDMSHDDIVIARVKKCVENSREIQFSDTSDEKTTVKEALDWALAECQKAGFVLVNRSTRMVLVSDAPEHKDDDSAIVIRFKGHESGFLVVRNQTYSMNIATIPCSVIATMLQK